MKKYFLYILVAITVIGVLCFMIVGKSPLKYNSGYTSDGHHYYELPPGDNDASPDWGR